MLQTRNVALKKDNIYLIFLHWGKFVRWKKNLNIQLAKPILMIKQSTFHFFDPTFHRLFGSSFGLSWGKFAPSSAKKMLGLSYRLNSFMKKLLII